VRGEVCRNEIGYTAPKTFQNHHTGASLCVRL
jgi:hypothetical protein